MSKKSALIITDGTDSIQSIAKSIDSVLDAFSVKLCTAQDFKGEDLLAADIFFIGCEEPNPASFIYLEEMLAHINLASRKCGIFSVKEKALKYLKSIIKDSETDFKELLADSSIVSNGEVKEPALKKWACSL